MTPQLQSVDHKFHYDSIINKASLSSWYLSDTLTHKAKQEECLFLSLKAFMANKECTTVHLLQRRFMPPGYTANALAKITIPSHLPKTRAQMWKTHPAPDLPPAKRFL